MKTKPTLSPALQTVLLSIAALALITAIVLALQIAEILRSEKSSALPSSTASRATQSQAAPTQPARSATPEQTPMTEALAATQASTAQVQPRSETLFDYFPLEIGSTWTYSVTHVTEGQPPEQGNFTETILTIEPGPAEPWQIVAIQTTGKNPLTRCAAGEAEGSPSPDTYYVVNEEQLFIVCSKEDANRLVSEMEDMPKGGFPASGETPSYVSPFMIGKLWPAFPDVNPPDDGSYQWQVESISDVDTPAGLFTGCYRILLVTLPDTTIMARPSIPASSWPATSLEIRRNRKPSF
jgi:hypothetical protein